jgi:tetratricopeptide (TPR) repeat protein
MGVRRTRQHADDLAKKVTKSLALFLQELHGGNQDEFAWAAGVSRRTVSRAVTGARAIRRSLLMKLAAAAGVLHREDFEALLAITERIHARRAGPAATQASARRAEEQGLKDAATGLARPLRAYLERRFVVARAGQTEHDQKGEDAAVLWARLAPYPSALRLELVEEVEEFHSIELAELLCTASLAATAANADEAVDLAQLAVRAAVLAPPTEGREEVRVKAWGHLGNALRVKSDLAGADRALATARRLWDDLERRGKQPSEVRLLSFEASLRRAQRRFADAQALLNRALSSGELICHLLLKKSSVLREMGDFEGALRTSQEVETLLQSDDDPRLRFIASFNSVDYLSVLERFAEADARLPVVRRLAEGVAGEIERLRLRWVEGRIAAGLGREEEGLAILEEVRRNFERREMSYDWALASLDLALLHLARGENTEVQKLARAMARVFRDKEIHRETLAALTLFCRAAEQEKATAELGREVVRFLHAARHNPELRFEAAGER